MQQSFTDQLWTHCMVFGAMSEKMSVHFHCAMHAYETTNLGNVDDLWKNIDNQLMCSDEYHVTYVTTHAGNKNDASSTLGDHVSCSFSRSEEGAVHVDVIQTLDAVEWVARWPSVTCTLRK